MQADLADSGQSAAAIATAVPEGAPPGPCHGPRFRSPQHEAIYTVLRSATELRDALSRTLAPFDLTPEQYNILRILRGAGPRGAAVCQIRERMTTRVPAMTRLLDKMAAKGLISRERESLDRRQVNCSLTCHGSSVLAQLDSRMDDADVSVMARLTECEVTQLIGLLTKARGAWETRDACPAEDKSAASADLDGAGA